MNGKCSPKLAVFLFSAFSLLNWSPETLLAQNRTPFEGLAGALTRAFATRSLEASVWSDAAPLEPSAICCPGSNSRGTLFQWSYGTSFSGGPDLDERLVTDRPDFTEASTTVGKGVAQIEFGYTYTFDDDGNDTVKEHSIGEPLLRFGIFEDWLELRVGLSPMQESAQIGGVSRSTAGTADLYLGFKLGLTPQEGLLPEMALIPQMNVPTGSNAFTSHNVEPGVNWIYAWEINDFLSVAGSTQGNKRVDDTSGESYLETAQSVTVGYSLSETLGAYTEWFAFFPSGADTAQVEHFFNGGFSYLISNDVQFDIRAGVGLNDAAADYFVGTGLSIRFK